MTKVHLIGIGGAGMSGLARLYKAEGYTVSGSDSSEGPTTRALMFEGITVTIPQAAEHITTGTELVVHTLAVPEDNPELVEAKKRGIRTLTYPEAVGEFLTGRRLVAVTGTHGKTTTTGMLLSALTEADEHPSGLVGAGLPLLEGRNAILGKHDFFILEACEYRRAFLQYQPEIMVVTTLEADHLDYYTDEADYVSAFVELARKLPPHGLLIAHGDEPLLAPVRDAAPHFFDAAPYYERVPGLTLTGAHNRRNAALALAAADLMGIDPVLAAQGIAHYSGAERRMELRGQLNGADVYDDYAHHPTEVAATIQALREKAPGKRLIAVYQQHQVGRVTAFLPRLAAALRAADIVLIPDVYAVRESAEGAETAASALTEAIGDTAQYTHGQAGAEAYLRQHAASDDVILVMGAGTITELARALVSEKK